MIQETTRRSPLGPEAPDPTRGARWTLSRAGIINVFQYGHETLHFAGGRLLLRGVNGAGKSTAMNMLLPFLLDGDTRRIDAAGEQAGVLHAWMLSGRDEPQAQGYLWLELAKGNQYTCFGCGIRANRSTDRITTWWFVTPRRPGIDLHLVEGRVPLTGDRLRAAIAPDVVYSQDQRAAYRAELRSRLFGGSDLEQHLDLLRIVRNPRVGDRLDADLPRYLEDALPRLSDAALDDAAQPLEDLEEHRRNVTELARTAEALGAIQEVYRSYARTELHRIAGETLDKVERHDERRRDEAQAHADERAAARRLDAATAEREQQERAIGQLNEEIRALEASEAYRSGAQLNDLRSHVASLARSVDADRAEATRRHAAVERAARNVERAAVEAREARNALRERLARLSERTAACGLAARPPGAPSLATLEAPDGALELPASPLDAALPDRQLADLRAAAQQRRLDVDEVERAMRRVDTTEQQLRAAEHAARQAAAAHQSARTEVDQALASFRARVEEWTAASRRWLEELQQRHPSHGLSAGELGALLDDPASRVAAGESITAPLRDVVDRTLERHQATRADLEADLAHREQELAELRARVAELAARQLPDPPAQPWQRRGDRPCLAELVDFAEGLESAARAGLEAALEASGLLAAEVHTDGVLELADGQLLVAGAIDDVPAPLANLLRICPPGDDPRHPTALAVSRVLHGISTDLAQETAHCAVTPEGEFRIGPLRGRHRKPHAEHIGIAARRTALERQRNEAAEAFERARDARDALATRLAAAKDAVADAQRLRRAIPPERELLAALARREAAERHEERAAHQLAQRRSDVAAAEQQHADAVEQAQRTALRLSLPHRFDALHSIRSDLDAIVSDCREAQREIAALAQAVERWRARGDDWQNARTDHASSEKRLVETSTELETARTRLATLEATIGAEYGRIVAALETTRGALEQAQTGREQAERDQTDARDKVATTRALQHNATLERERAEAECLRALPVLRQALVVPGLVDAAAGDADADGPPSAEADAALPAGASVSFPSVDEHPDGARHLAEAVRRLIPAPGEAATSAEGVRQSLRRRRDTLGAGWDAEDHQPDARLPLRIEVNGPITPLVPLAEATIAVRRQLRHLESLLSTKQDHALRNLLQGLVAREVAARQHAAAELIEGMNRRLATVTTAHGIGVSLRWRQRDDLEPDLAAAVALLAKPPDLRTSEEDAALSRSLGQRLADARRDDPDVPYRELIARVLDYRSWHHMHVLLQRPGRTPERLGRRTALSEGEKKIVSYLPLFAAVAASCDGLAASAHDAPRFVLLDDAFAKVSEDNHAKLFGLLVELDLDFVATSERLWGTHDTVPELAITEVIRDAELGTIVLEHSHWDGRQQSRA